MQADLAAAWPRPSPYIPHRPTGRQAAFVWLSDREAFYGGAAGGGKSDALLMAALKYVQHRGYNAVIVRESFPSLSAPGGLMERAMDWLLPTDATWNGTEHQWRFPSGASLSFRPLGDQGDERGFMGAEYQCICVDEVQNIREQQYRFLKTRLRRLAGSTIPVRMRATGMPYGPNIDWVRRYFVLGGPEHGRIFIPSRLSDNRHLDRDDYLMTLSDLDPLTRAQVLLGDWSVRPEGGMFDASWFEDRLVDLRSLPADIRLCRYWDLAASEQIRGTDPDFTAGVLLGRDRDGIFYVLDVVRTRATPLGVQHLVRRTAEQDRQLALRHGWRQPAIRMEQEPGSAGKAIVDVYARLVLAGFDFKGVTSSGSKEARAAPVSARAEAGHVLLCGGEWNGAFLDELCAFPQVRHDDQVDALSGAYAQLVEVERRGHARISRINFGDSQGRVGGRRRFVDPPPPPPPWERGRRDWYQR